MPSAAVPCDNPEWKRAHEPRRGERQQKQVPGNGNFVLRLQKMALVGGLHQDIDRIPMIPGTSFHICLGGKMLPHDEAQVNASVDESPVLRMCALLKGGRPRQPQPSYPPPPLPRLVIGLARTLHAGHQGVGPPGTSAFRAVSSQCLAVRKGETQRKDHTWWCDQGSVSDPGTCCQFGFY